MCPLIPSQLHSRCCIADDQEQKLQEQLVLLSAHHSSHPCRSMRKSSEKRDFNGRDPTGQSQSSGTGLLTRVQGHTLDPPSSSTSPPEGRLSQRKYL